MPRLSTVPPVAQPRAGVAEHPSDDQQPLSFEEINQMYPGEWVLLKVIGADERQQVTDGLVLEHGSSRRKIARAEDRARRVDPNADLRVLIGGTGTITVDQWSEALRRAAALGPLRAGG